jgi:hypothetical protein
VTIATNVQTAGIRNENRPSGKSGVVGSGWSLAILLLPLVTFNRRRRISWLRVFGSIFVGMLLLQGTMGCGGASNSSTTHQGQYSITITATSGTLSHSATLALTVQ